MILIELCKTRCHRSLRSLALVTFLLLITTGVASAQLPHIPSNCNRVCLNIPSMGASPTVVLNGESSSFDFTVSNRDTTKPNIVCCEADHVTVLLCCPDADGNETLPVRVGGSTPGASCA